MGNVVRACLGRDYSMSHSQQQTKTTLSWDLLMIFKVMCYVLFDVSPRGSGAFSEDNAGGVERARRCSAPSPANLLRLLYRRHVLKSKVVDTHAFSHCQTTTTTSCKFSLDILHDDDGSSIYGGEKDVVQASLPQPRALEVWTWLNSEVQSLKTKLERQEEEVRRLTEEVVTLRGVSAAAAAPAASRPEGQSPKNQSTRIVSPGSVLVNDTCDDDDPSSYTDHPLSISTKGGSWLENVNIFQPAMRSESIDDQKTVDEVRLCTSSQDANLEHYDHAATADLHSPVRVGTKALSEHCLQEHRFSPLQPNARESFDCKCGDYVDWEFGQDAASAAVDATAATRSEIDLDDLDNLSMWSFESADTRDFQCVGATPKCLLKRGDDYQEQVEWSSEELSKDPFMLHRDRIHWTSTDPGTGAKRRQVQQRHSELEDQLLKTLQSPRREILPQIINTNSNSCTSSGSSSPRSTSSVSGQGGLFWEPCRKTEGSKTPQHLSSDKKFDLDIDFSTEKRKSFRALSSTNGQSHHSVDTVESSGRDEFDQKHFPLVSLTRHWERLVIPEVSTSRSDSTQAHGEAYANTRGRESRPAVDLLQGEKDCGEVDLVEVALETFKVCNTGEICSSDNRNRNRHEREDSSFLYRESQCNCNSSMTYGINHLRRHSSFGGGVGHAGTRQSRFGVEAARLSRRKHGHQRGCSF